MTTGFIVAIGLAAVFAFFQMPTLLALIVAQETRAFLRMRVPIFVTLTSLFVVTVLFKPIAFMLVVVLGFGFNMILWNRAADKENAPAVPGRAGLIETFSDAAGKEWSAICFIYIFALLSAYNFGYQSAIRQSTFLTTGDFAVVAIYGDVIIAMQEHTRRNGVKPPVVSLGPVLKVIPVGQSGPIAFDSKTFSDVAIYPDDKSHPWQLFKW